MTHAHVETIAQAYDLAYRLIGSDKKVELDQESSERSGCQIRRFEGGWISDLRTRLEINFNDGETLTVWIDSQKQRKPQIADLIFLIEDLKEKTGLEEAIRYASQDRETLALINILYERLTR